VSQHQKGKTNLDFTEAGDSEWQWHQLGHMHSLHSPQTDNQASTPPLILSGGVLAFSILNDSNSVKFSFKI